jgi:hypothetical protein
MSFIRLKSGKILVIDTVDISDPSIKHEVDQLTNKGDLIEAVVATHPFHTIYFTPFFHCYPNAKYYGTPRHIRNNKVISWAGDISESVVRQLWQQDGVHMVIPAGSEFVNIADESNHFISVIVFHEASRTVHVDDTIQYFGDSCVLRCCCLANSMHFWDLDKGLDKTADAPRLFRDDIEKMLSDWDFDNICAAHVTNKIGGAKEQLRQVLVKATPKLTQLTQKYSSK